MKAEDNYRPLKDPNAEKLRQAGSIEIEGMRVNLWSGHTQDSVRNRYSWDQVKSYKHLNQKSPGHRGNIVITGTLQIPRSEAAIYASKCGFKVLKDLNKSTNFVVLGTENVSPTKISKALELNNQGEADIRFIQENDFLEWITDLEENNATSPIPIRSITIQLSTLVDVENDPHLYQLMEGLQPFINEGVSVIIEQDGVIIQKLT